MAQIGQSTREKCNQAKIFHESGAETVLEDSNCGDQSEKLYWQSAGVASSRRTDRASKTADMRRANIRKTDNRVG
jgi:hypothetical protein